MKRNGKNIPATVVSRPEFTAADVAALSQYFKATIPAIDWPGVKVAVALMEKVEKGTVKNGDAG